MLPLIWAHRGSRTEAPENTMEAFRLAISQGADGIELDVHLTKDGEVVVAHDETVDRVSNGTGRIVDMTLAELRTLDFSKGFPSFSPAEIPTLSEVCELIAPTSLSINVEIKSGVVLYEGIEKKVMEIVNRHGISSRVLYSSFNHYSLMALKSLDPSVKIGLLYSEALVDPQLYAARIGADAIHPFYPTLISPGVVQGCKALGIKIHPWTINNSEHISAAIALGVDAIITDVPKTALGLLKESDPK